MTEKPWYAMSKAEVKAKTVLTPTEQKAIDDLFAALRKWPRSLHLNINDNDDTDDGVEVFKKYASGAAQRVAFLRKKNLESI